MNISEQLQQALATALAEIAPEQDPATIKLERSRDSTHGDFASNVAFLLAKPMRQAPKLIAEQILAKLNLPEAVAKAEVAGNGFINFFLKQEAQFAVIENILALREQFGHVPTGKAKLHIEIVSANPTGPLHVGHGRLAAYCDSMANLLAARGYQVHREYYLNDAGRQMNILAASIWLRYLELCGQAVELPKAAYQGDYVVDIARELRSRLQDSYVVDLQSKTEAFSHLADADEQIDAWISFAKQHLDTAFSIFFKAGLNAILADIRDDLSSFSVKVDCYFGESRLAETDLPSCFEQLKRDNLLYQRDGASWFKSTEFGDDKDRVVIRENGELTYFASDIAYHWNKYQRGFTQVVDVLGADHHGYVPRMRAFIRAIGQKSEQFRVALIQLVNLYRGSEKISMSTRKGQFITLRQLRDEVGKDAARYFYITRRSEQPLDFDLELAKSKSQDNPVYYIQYAHARICSVLRQHQEKFGKIDFKQLDFSVLSEAREQELARKLNSFNDCLDACCRQLEPVILSNYLHELAGLFHSYYNSSTFLVDQAVLRQARLALITAVKEVLANGLRLVGISHPEMM